MEEKRPWLTLMVVFGINIGIILLVQCFFMPIG